MKELPIGVQDFETLMTNGMVYVDKTDIIYRMIENYSWNFIARPRLFGKSLLVSTLESLFSRGTGMFKGLAIEKLWTDKTYSVIHLAFSRISCRSAEEFDLKARELFMGELVRLGFPHETIESCSRCVDLQDMAYEAFSDTGLCSLVLLLDDYDCPLNLNLRDRDVFVGIQHKIRGFYDAVRENQGSFRFIFVTGVSRFSRAETFGADSYLEDLSLNPLYASLLGFTEDEIRHYFGEHLRSAAASVFRTGPDKVTEEQLLLVMDALRRHYGGYCFDKTASLHVLEPWSVLRFLSPDGSHEFSDYWYRESGVSSLLSSSGMLTHGAAADDFRTQSMDRHRFMVNPGPGNPPDRLFLLTWCGYFTVKKVTALRIRVGLPNLELRRAWARLLMSRLRDENAMPDELCESLEDACAALRRENISAEKLALIFNLAYKALNSSRIETGYAACGAPALCCLDYGFDVTVQSQDKEGPAGMVFDFLSRRIIIGMKCLREGESAEEKLREAEAEISSKDCGSLVPAKPLRRFAMVFSVPMQKIVLTEEVTA